MTITPRNFLRHEIVGLKAHVVKSKDPSLVCRKGIVKSESKEMILLETEQGKTIMIPKGVCMFDFLIPDNTVVRVDGSILSGRPEDRLKKPQKRKW